MVACAPDELATVQRIAADVDVPLRVLGAAGGATLLGVEIAELRAAWEGDD